MKETDTGSEKVQKICDVLRRETLEPAKKDAEQIIRDAEKKAAQILQDAKIEAEKMKKTASDEVEKQKSVFQSSLNQACRQSLDALKDSIENELFDKELSSSLTNPLQQPKVIADLIQAVINAIEKEGTNADLDVIIPKSIPSKAINDLLAKQALDKLKNQSVSLGPIQGGIELKMDKENMTIDITDVALKEMVAKYIRKDFREILFRKN